MKKNWAKLFTASFFAISLLSAGNANAQLYGFSHFNDINEQEELLTVTDRELPKYIPNYRNQLRKMIISLSKFAKDRDENFQIITHEGRHLINKEKWEFDLEEYLEARKYGYSDADEIFIHSLFRENAYDRHDINKSPRIYAKSIDGMIFNNLYCKNNKLSKKNKTIIEDNHYKLFSVDECKDNSDIYKSQLLGYANKTPLYGFASGKKPFSTINSKILYVNSNNIKSVKDVKNYTMILDDYNFNSKSDLIMKLQKTNYDMIVLKPFFQDKKSFTIDEINSLKYKLNGGKRLVIAMMNLTEAEDNAYYWKDSWSLGTPHWLDRLSFVKKYSVIVKYWHKEWTNIIGSYFVGVLDTGYDGVIFTGLDNHSYFETRTRID